VYYVVAAGKFYQAHHRHAQAQRLHDFDQAGGAFAQAVGIMQRFQSNGGQRNRKRAYQRHKERDADGLDWSSIR